jgi:hypothetical protein
LDSGVAIKVQKQVTGKIITIGDRTLIPTIEYSTYHRKFKVRNHSGFVFTEITLQPSSIKVIEGEEEWVLPLQE